MDGWRCFNMLFKIWHLSNSIVFSHTTLYSFLFFYIAPSFSFQPIFLSLKVSFFLFLFLVIFFSFFSTPFLALPTHSGMLIISISISHPAKLLNLYLTNKWLLGLRKVHVFISSVDSLFLLQWWVSGVTVRGQGSEKRKEGKGREGRKEGRNETLHGWQNLVLSSFFLLPFFFLSFLWLLLLVINNYYWTRLRCVASDPGNSWYSVKKGCCLLRSSLWFLRLCFSWVSFSWPFFFNSFFLVFRDNECWLCFSSLL